MNPLDQPQLDIRYRLDLQICGPSSSYHYPNETIQHQCYNGDAPGGQCSSCASPFAPGQQEGSAQFSGPGQVFGGGGAGGAFQRQG